MITAIPIAIAVIYVLHRIATQERQIKGIYKHEYYKMMRDALNRRNHQ